MIALTLCLTPQTLLWQAVHQIVLPLFPPDYSPQHPLRSHAPALSTMAHGLQCRVLLAGLASENLTAWSSVLLPVPLLGCVRTQHPWILQGPRMTDTWRPDSPLRGEPPANQETTILEFIWSRNQRPSCLSPYLFSRVVNMTFTGIFVLLNGTSWSLQFFRILWGFCFVLFWLVDFIYKWILSEKPIIIMAKIYWALTMGQTLNLSLYVY